MSIGVCMDSFEQPEQQEMTMPLLAATTTDGGVFIAGQAPHYGTSQESEAWMNAFDAEGETEVNALFDNGDHVIVEVLTEMGLDKKEKKIDRNRNRSKRVMWKHPKKICFFSLSKSEQVCRQIYRILSISGREGFTLSISEPRTDRLMIRAAGVA